MRRCLFDLTLMSSGDLFVGNLFAIGAEALRICMSEGRVTIVVCSCIAKARRIGERS